MNEKFSPRKVAEALSEITGISVEKIEQFLDALSSIVQDGIHKHQHVSVKNVGAFDVTHVSQSETTGPNGKKIVEAEHYELTFAPTKAVREQINKPFEFLGPPVEIPEGADLAEIQAKTKKLIDADAKHIADAAEENNAKQRADKKAKAAKKTTRKSQDAEELIVEPLEELDELNADDEANDHELPPPLPDEEVEEAIGEEDEEIVSDDKAADNEDPSVAKKTAKVKKQRSGSSPVQAAKNASAAVVKTVAKSTSQLAAAVKAAVGKPVDLLHDLADKRRKKKEAAKAEKIKKTAEVEVSEIDSEVAESKQSAQRLTRKQIAEKLRKAEIDKGAAEEQKIDKAQAKAKAQNDKVQAKADKVDKKAKLHENAQHKAKKPGVLKVILSSPTLIAGAVVALLFVAGVAWFINTYKPFLFADDDEITTKRVPESFALPGDTISLEEILSKSRFAEDEDSLKKVEDIVAQYDQPLEDDEEDVVDTQINDTRPNRNLQAVTPEPKTETEQVVEKTTNVDKPVSKAELAPKTVTNKPVAAPKTVDADEKVIAKVKMAQGGRLTLLSLKYYGDKIFWVYIYDFNKETIGPNPNNVEVGTEILIPAKSIYGINANDPNSYEKARAKQAELMK